MDVDAPCAQPVNRPPSANPGEARNEPVFLPLPQPRASARFPLPHPFPHQPSSVVPATPNPLPLENPALPPSLWPLQPDLAFLNHGSFGSCPLSVLHAQSQLRLRLEANPISFLVRDLEPLLDHARSTLARFVGAHPEDLVLVTNATTGVNTVLRSLSFQPGDELLTTDHAYNACRNALNVAAEQAGARVVVASIPFPISSPKVATEAILAAVSPRTRLLLLDHVTSPTGLLLPVQDIVRQLDALGVDTLVDGAHAPGMLPLDLNAIGAAYYTGNAHKWLCAPKGAAFLHVRADRQSRIRPLVISHGANSRRTDRSRFQLEFAWTGTLDPTAALCIPLAIETLASSVSGGWPAIQDRNRALALAARHLLCQALHLEPPCPDSMIGALAALPLPPSTSPTPSLSPLYLDAWQDQLRDNWRIEVPIIPWPHHPRRLVRISAQLYNALPQYQLLAHSLQSLMTKAAGPLTTPFRQWGHI